MTTTRDVDTPSSRRRRDTPSRRRAPHGRRAARGRRRSPWRTALLVTLALVVLGTAGLGWIYLKLNGDISTF
ncbi:LytR family transcriptional regulator, partial [Streptomyces sp. NPDC000405]